MSIGYNFAENVIILEFVLVGAIIITTLTVKIYAFISLKRNKNIKMHVEQYLHKIIHAKQQITKRSFPNKWKKINILLQVIEDIDKIHTSDDWEQVKTGLVKFVMLPLARKYVLSRHWTNRLYAARTFYLNSEESDDKLITRLINDKIPLVFLYAVKAALSSHSRSALDAMIKRMASVEWVNHFIYLEAFEEFALHERRLFEKQLKNTKDPAERAVCYKILLCFPPDPIQWDISKDINSSNLELKISAMKLISYVDRKAAIPLLVNLLTDDLNEVRLIALHRLDMLKAKEAIPNIAACLNDTDWSVKLSAAEALKNMGEEGDKVLKSQGTPLGKISFNIKHLLNTWW